MITVVGPQRVLAAVQYLVGYVSGNGSGIDDFQDLFNGFTPTLVLPDGERITMRSMRSGGPTCCRRGQIHFPPIPQDVERGWLEIEIAGDVSQRGEFQPGRVPFDLVEASEIQHTDETVEMIIPIDLPIETSAPKNIQRIHPMVNETVNGVTIAIQEVTLTDLELEANRIPQSYRLELSAEPPQEPTD